MTVPRSGTTSPFSSRAKVDLPEPLAPMTPIRCSSSSDRDVVQDGAALGGVRVADAVDVDQRHDSTTIATPWPPPTAMAASPSSPTRPVRTSWVNSRTASTAPEAPHG